MRVRPLPFLLALLPAVALAAGATQATVPITTSSSEARALYLQGRDLAERLKITEANLATAKALEKDPNFALAHLQQANTSGTAKEFFAGVAKAVALVDKVSDGERLIIIAADAASKGKPAEQRQALEQLVQKYPNDARAHNQLGLFFFGQQDWEAAIRELTRSTEIEPNFTGPYNQLGYAYRLQGKYAESEKTFQKYSQLLPDDPNPPDSYAELLMKMGRFEDSIAKYHKALAVDPNFQSARVGIANDQMFLGRGDDARKTLQESLAKARNDGERRQAWFWTSQSYSNEGRWADALKAVQEEKKIADASGDYLSGSQDLNLMGNIALAAGNPAEAATRFDESLKLVAKANVSDEVKENARRNNLFNVARVALKKGDLQTAKATSAKYSAAVEVKKIPFERWQAHELAGMIALHSKDYDGALRELAQSTIQNPRVLYLTGLAYQGKGDSAKAAEAFKSAADFNALHPLYAFVRSDARRQLTRS